MMTQPEHALDHSSLKQAFGRLASGTSVVTLVDETETKMGFTATAVTSVSVEPALMLVCVNSLSRTVPVFQAGMPFVINLLTEAQQEIAMQFASRDGDKFANVQYARSASGALYLKDTLIGIECVPQEIHLAGDHHIVIGRVTALHTEVDAQPLVFFRSRFMA